MEAINREQPAAGVVEAFGSMRKLAIVAGVKVSTVSRWCTTADRRGTGGQIPQKYWPIILQAAKKRGIDVDLHTLSGISK